MTFGERSMGSCAFAAAAARLAGFGFAAPCECDYCVVIIEKPLELGVHKIKPGYWSPPETSRMYFKHCFLEPTNTASGCSPWTKE
jgi:hypothetical protein